MSPHTENSPPPRRRRARTAALGAATGLVLVLPALSTVPATASSDAGDRAVDAAHARSSTIDLPTGFRPEGIAARLRRPVAYLGSRDTGELLRLNLRTGEHTVFSEATGTPSLGLDLDRRGLLWVSGGTGGDARAVSARTGEVLATYQLSEADSFVNDVVLYRGAAWFTDSYQARLYRVPVADPPFGQTAVETLPLGGEWEQVAGELNANGITSTPDGDALLVVNSTTGRLFRVDPATGDATTVDLGGASLTFGDGMRREGRTLYVVRNQRNRIVELRLSPDGSRGRRVGARTSPDFDVPTTIARFRDTFVLPNARFTSPAATDFDAVSLPAPR